MASLSLTHLSFMLAALGYGTPQDSLLLKHRRRFVTFSKLLVELDGPYYTCTVAGCSLCHLLLLDRKRTIFALDEFRIALTTQQDAPLRSGTLLSD